MPKLVYYYSLTDKKIQGKNGNMQKNNVPGILYAGIAWKNLLRNTGG